MSATCMSQCLLYFNSQASYEARPVVLRKVGNTIKFQFTGLIRGPTAGELFFFNDGEKISIHRPHTRPDVPYQAESVVHQYFNSQASYEARRHGLSYLAFIS